MDSKVDKVDIYFSFDEISLRGLDTVQKGTREEDGYVKNKKNIGRK
jgi:hypothetical protein